MRKNLAAISILAAAAVLVTGGVASACAVKVSHKKHDKPHKVVKPVQPPVDDEEIPVVIPDTPAPESPKPDETPAPTPVVEASTSPSTSPAPQAPVTESWGK